MKPSLAKLIKAAEKLSIAENRFQHLKVISEYPGINIGQISIAMRLPCHSTASRHITELENIGWVKKVKDGKFECCYITDRCIKDISAINKFCGVKDKRFFWAINQ